MSIYVKCEGCGKILNVPDGCEGRLIQCATCAKRMRVPNRPPTAAESAPPPAAPASPAPAAPASEGLPNDQAAFFRALVEETEREQRETAAAKAAQKQAEAELAPLAETPAGEPGAVAAETLSPPPSAPTSAAPSHGGTPDEDSFFNALAQEAARQQRETDASKEAEPGAEAAPAAAPSPVAMIRGKSSAATELRIKTVADKSGYAIAEDTTPPADFAKPQRRAKKLVGMAAGVLVLLILFAVVIMYGLSGKKTPPPAKAVPLEQVVLEAAERRGSSPAKRAPVVNAQPEVLPPSTASPVSPPELAVPPPDMPPALKEAALALTDKALVEVEVAEAASDSASPQTPILTPTGDLMLDMTNLHVRDKSDADASLQEMRTASRSAVFESVAAGLREKGLTPVEAGQSAPAKPGEPHSRLRIDLRATPAWAGFSFREGPAMNNSTPVQPGQPLRRQPRMRPEHDIQFTRRGPSAPPSSPVRLWERLLSGGLTMDARFTLDGNWSALAADDVQAEALPCGLRLSIVRLVWEVGDRTHALVGRSAEADATLSGDAAEAGGALPFHRPKQIREIQLTGRMAPDRTCLISGFCQYEDVDLHDGAAEAGKLVAGLLAGPEADWNTVWDGKAGRDPLAGACRNILRLDGGPALVEAMTAAPDRLPRPSADALAMVLKAKDSSPEWAIPFLALPGPCGDAALIGLARQAKEENEKYFLQWVAAPKAHSPESVQAACCALIDLGRPGPEVNALIDERTVNAFSEVRSPRASLAFPPQTAQTVLVWLIRNGTDSQRIAAVAAAVDGNVENLQDSVRAFVGRSLGSDPTTLCRLCKGIEKARTPLAFEILSLVAERQLLHSDAGDGFPPPETLPEAGGPPAAGRYSRTVAALVCAGLARFGRFEAGKVLEPLIRSPGPATRYCAIETLIALDDVDACADIRARFEELGKQARNAYEQQEWELVNPVRNTLCRYYIPLLTARNSVKNGVNLKEAIETCEGIIKEDPSPADVKDAQELKRKAEALLERK